MLRVAPSYPIVTPKRVVILPRDTIQQGYRGHKDRVPSSTKTQQVRCSARFKCFGGLVAVGNALLSPTWLICRQPFSIQWMSFQLWLVPIWVPKPAGGGCLAVMDLFRCCCRRRLQSHQVPGKGCDDRETRDTVTLWETRPGKTFATPHHPLP